MTDEKLNNPSAFPIPADAGLHAQEFGMTLRDYFAAAALNGILSAHAVFKRKPDPIGKYDEEMEKMSAIEIATAVFQYADAMLKARES